jgi:hypothetical protein
MSGKHSDMAIGIIPSRWGITASDRNVLIVLAAKADVDNDTAYPGIPYIAMRTGLSEDTVRRCLRTLEAAGWLTIIQRKRENGSTTSNLYVISLGKLIEVDEVQRAEELARKQAETRGAAPRTMLGAPGTMQGAPLAPCEGPPLHGATPIISEEINIHTTAAAREGLDIDAAKQLIGRICDAAGQALADPISAPNLSVTSPVLALLTMDPPCIEQDLVDAAAYMGSYYLGRYGQGSLKSWRKVCEKAMEIAADRRKGFNHKAVVEPAGQGIGDPATFDRDKWRSLVMLSNHRGGDWKSSDWGPPPGAPGSFVPADLVELWKGAAAAVEGVR